MNQNEKNTKIFSLFAEFQVAENRPRQKKLRAETKKQQIGIANHNLRSQNYCFANDQNGNEALKLATIFNELK